MQTWILNTNFYKSAKKLHPKHRHAQIYEAIHILSSLLNMSDKLVNPKKNVSNHPAAKQWKGHEFWLYKYIQDHIHAAQYKNNNINLQNMEIIGNAYTFYPTEKPLWLEKHIPYHKSRLCQHSNLGKWYQEKWQNIPLDLPQIYNGVEWYGN